MSRRQIILISVFTFICMNLWVSIPGSYAAKVKGQPGTSIKTNEDAKSSSFISNYSEMLGVALDSCCNRKFIASVAEWLGTPYRRGGLSKKGIDCSGFVSYIYKEVFNIKLAHSSASMIFQMKTRVKKADIQPGDILFYKIHGKRISHVAIYLGDYKIIHASPERGIVVDDIREPYYVRHYYTAGRPE